MYRLSSEFLLFYSRSLCLGASRLFQWFSFYVVYPRLFNKVSSSVPPPFPFIHSFPHFATAASAAPVLAPAAA